jgi:hypothetical protein
MGVHEAGPAHHEEIRDDRHLLGNHQCGHQEECDQRSPGKPHARQRIAGKRRDNQRQYRHGDGDVERVEVLPCEGLMVENLNEVPPLPFARNEAGRPKNFGRALEAGRDHPKEGEDEGNSGNAERNRPANLIEKAHPALREKTSHVSLRRNTSWTIVRTMTITNMIMASADA